MAGEPGADLWMLVRGVIVEDGVDQLAGRHFRLDGIEEADELLMAMALQRHTTGFDFPDRRITSKVPQPSAVARTMLARQTCFCGALRSATIASSRRRSSGVTLTTIPALMPRACTASTDLGIVRRNHTTSAVAVVHNQSDLV